MICDKFIVETTEKNRQFWVDVKRVNEERRTSYVMPLSYHINVSAAASVATHRSSAADFATFPSSSLMVLLVVVFTKLTHVRSLIFILFSFYTLTKREHHTVLCLLRIWVLFFIFRLLVFVCWFYSFVFLSFVVFSWLCIVHAIMCSRICVLFTSTPTLTLT